MLKAEELRQIQNVADKLTSNTEVLFAASELNAITRFFLSFLATLGAIKLSDFADTQQVQVSISGKVARRIPLILSMFLRNGYVIFDDWSRVLNIPEDHLLGLEFLQQLELRRIDSSRREGKRPEFVDHRPAAFAVIRGKDKHGQTAFLFETNKDWGRLNFIGGKQEPADLESYEETLRREITEELGIARNRVTLQRLNNEPIVGYAISGNAGGLTDYPAVLFGVTIRGKFPVRLRDRWLDLDTIRQCMELDDSPIMVNPSYMDFLLKGHPTTMSQAPLTTNSFVNICRPEDVIGESEGRFTRWQRVATQNKDLVIVITGLVAALITLTAALVGAFL